MLVQTENKWQRELLKECNISYIMFRFKSSVIRQKGESQNGCFKKTKHAKFPKNEHFLPPDTHTYECVSEGFVFRKIWRALFSWNTRFEIRPFALLPANFRFLNHFLLSWFGFNYYRFLSPFPITVVGDLTILCLLSIFNFNATIWCCV